MPQQYEFTLYVAGDGELSARARTNFERLIATRLRGRCQLIVIDILRDPKAARQNRVVVTPLLVREKPGPVIKVLGDLSAGDSLIERLGIDPSPSETADE